MANTFLPLEELVIRISQLFTAHKLHFSLAGGWAVSLWGAVRATEDLDFIVVMDNDDRGRIESILSSEFRVTSHKNMMLDTTATPLWRYVLTSDRINDHCVLDIIPASSNFLKNAVKRCIELPLHNAAIPVIAIEDLILLKIMSGRNKDIEDARSLISGGMIIDKEYVRNTATTLGVDIASFM